MAVRNYAAVFLSVICFQNIQIATAAAVDLSSKEAKLSYTLGVDIGKNFQHQQIVVDPALIARGMADAMSGNTLQMTNADMQDTLVAFNKDLIMKRTAQVEALSEKNAQAGEAFLAENAKKEGVVTTASGLQYKIVEPGKGGKPGDNDTVTVTYTGTLVNGQVFDQSKTPVSFPVKQVIPAWTEALKLMAPGATFEVYAPPKLAYGKTGVLGGPIGPNETLIFTVHLISSKKTS